MPTDRQGNAVEAGDEIVIRGRVVAIAVEAEGVAILQVSWHDSVPLLDFVRAENVEVVKGGE